MPTDDGGLQRSSEKVQKIVDAEDFASVDGVVLGVDTHLDAHVAVALDGLGRHLGAFTLPTTKRGYEGLLRWAEGLGFVGCAGIEGTSSYGAGLARYLKAAGVSVVWWRSKGPSAVIGVALAKSPRRPSISL